MFSQRASSATWIELDPSGHRWFENVAWDLWLLVVADGRVVVLAATDTD